MEFGKEIISILDYIGDKLGIAIDWSSQTMMPYVKDAIARIVQYEISTSIAWIVLAILLMIITSIVILLIKRKTKNYEERNWCNFFILIFIVIGSIIILVQTFDILRAINLPELTAYDYVKRISYQFK